MSKLIFFSLFRNTFDNFDFNYDILTNLENNNSLKFREKSDINPFEYDEKILNFLCEIIRKNLHFVRITRMKIFFILKKILKNSIKKYIMRFLIAVI